MTHTHSKMLKLILSDHSKSYQQWPKSNCAVQYKNPIDKTKPSLKNCTGPLTQTWPTSFTKENWWGMQEVEYGVEDNAQAQCLGKVREYVSTHHWLTAMELLTLSHSLTPKSLSHTSHKELGGLHGCVHKCAASEHRFPLHVQRFNTHRWSCGGLSSRLSLEHSRKSDQKIWFRISMPKSLCARDWKGFTLRAQQTRIFTTYLNLRI